MDGEINEFNPFELLSTEQLAELAIAIQGEIDGKRSQLIRISSEIGKRLAPTMVENVGQMPGQLELDILDVEEPVAKRANDTPKPDETITGAAKTLEVVSSTFLDAEGVEVNESLKAQKIRVMVGDRETIFADPEIVTLLDSLRFGSLNAKQLYALGFGEQRKSEQARQVALSNISSRLEGAGIIIRTRTANSKGFLYMIAEGVSIEPTEPGVLEPLLDFDETQTTENSGLLDEFLAQVANGLVKLGGMSFRINPNERELITILASKPGEFLTASEILERGYQEGKTKPARMSSLSYHWNGMSRSLKAIFETKKVSGRNLYRILEDPEAAFLKSREERAISSSEQSEAGLENTPTSSEKPLLHHQKIFDVLMGVAAARKPSSPALVRTGNGGTDSSDVGSASLQRFEKTVVEKSYVVALERTTRIVRIQNISELNDLTLQLAKRFNHKPKKLLIERDGLIYIDGDRLETGPFMTDVWNTLLLGYLSKPFSLLEAHTKFGFAAREKDTVLETRLSKLHRVLTELKFRNIVFYDPDTKANIGLKPVIITDKRRRTDS